MPVTRGLAGQHGGYLKSQLAGKNFIYRAPRDGGAPRSIGTGARSVSTCALGRDGCAYRLDNTRVDREGEVDGHPSADSKSNTRRLEHVATKLFFPTGVSAGPSGVVVALSVWLKT